MLLVMTAMVLVAYGKGMSWAGNSTTISYGFSELSPPASVEPTSVHTPESMHVVLTHPAWQSPTATATTIPALVIPTKAAMPPCISGLATPHTVCRETVPTATARVQTPISRWDKAIATPGAVYLWMPE